MNDTFANRLAKALKLRNMSQSELARAAGIWRTSISAYLAGKYKAKQDKVYAMACVLKVNPAWLMGMGDDSDMEWEPPMLDVSEDEAKNYYYDPETREIADAIANDKELRMLFDAARDVPAEDLKTVHKIMLGLKRAEEGRHGPS